MRYSTVVVPSFLAVLACLAGTPAAADNSSTVVDSSPTVRTSRDAARHLPLPEEDGVFHFLIFGDRTGGVPAGLPILARAVEDANLLDPDLVMTVGDLINGYCETDEWMRQMREFRAIMDKLSMPWFPVAGNHDIYFRGKDRPPEEHEGRYETHFGPVWYWFAHKDVGFLTLFSDEGDGTGSVRDYKTPAQLKMSDAQLAWLERSLAEMNSLRHVFVFLHHPRWMGQYRGGNWERVHEALVAAGNVRAVFAGHIHRMHYDGARDGIEYFALAATGANLSVDLPHAGYLHHVNLVTVRDDSFRVSTLPVGSVLDPRQFTSERWAEMDALRRMRPRVESPEIQFDETGKASGLLAGVIENPGACPLEVTVSFEHGTSWLLSPDHQHFVIPPRESQRFEVVYLRKATLADGVEAPRMVLASDYLAEDARITLPVARTELSVGPAPVSESYFCERAPRGVELREGKSSRVRVDPLRFDVPDGPFTAEAWVRLDDLKGSQAIAARTEMSEWGLFADDGKPSFMVFLGDAYVTARAAEPVLEVGTWHHVAAVFDGSELRVYADGRLVAKAAGSGSRKRNELPLYLGNDPAGGGGPGSAWLRGRIDEVRVSSVARYLGDGFRPESRHEPDASTALLLHLDGELGGFVFDHVTRRSVGRLEGGATLVPTKDRDEPRF